MFQETVCINRLPDFEIGKEFCTTNIGKNVIEEL